MSKKLDGHVVLITGAARGLGRGTAIRLAQEGATVIAADLSTCDDTIAAISDVVPDHRGRGISLDVVDAVAFDAAVARIVDEFGRLDVLVNNAGIVQTMEAVADTPDSSYDRIFDVNVRGTFNGCRAAARVMREAKRGAIVNFGSWYGKQGFAHFGLYCASKAAVIRLTESLALELAPHGIRANSICPGNMATDMHWKALKDEAELRGITFEEMDRIVKDSIPLGRQGTADDIASTVIFLASTDGAYLTGQAINVNGGILFS